MQRRFISIRGGHYAKGASSVAEVIARASRRWRCTKCRFSGRRRLLDTAEANADPYDLLANGVVAQRGAPGLRPAEEHPLIARYLERSAISVERDRESPQDRRCLTHRTLMAEECPRGRRCRKEHHCRGR